MDEYEQKFVNNMQRQRYWVKYSAKSGYNTHIVFFKRPGRDGSGFENDKTALKNIILSHKKTNSRLFELTAIVFGEVTFQVYWHEQYFADHARKILKEYFGEKAIIPYQLS
jgi:hypothetical protein